MKKLAIALAIAALAVSPAVAKSKHPQKSSTSSSDPADAYAYAPNGQTPAMDTPQSVYAYGQYQGADPDPFIRSQLQRDPPTVQW